jgi:hypothetical protein
MATDQHGFCPIHTGALLSIFTVSPCHPVTLSPGHDIAGELRKSLSEKGTKATQDLSGGA